tara:strand:- start:1347 stop:2120 length:774 start_codon:yes stop_codon:yes gene_type:complete
MISTFFTYLFFGFIGCGIADLISIGIYKLNNKIAEDPTITNLLHIKQISYSQNIRWFFIHTIVNLYITIRSFSELKYSMYNISTCYNDQWINGYEIYGIAISCHYYHIAMFKLNINDWIHHISSAIITGPIILLTNTTCLSVVGLFFTCGLPGLIDYILLWLVKMGWCDKLFEKKVYVYLSVWIRAPGCIYTASLFFGILPNIHQYSWSILIGRIWTTFIVFWNGLYFMHITLKDYYSNHYVNYLKNEKSSIKHSNQ